MLIQLSFPVREMEHIKSSNMFVTDLVALFASSHNKLLLFSLSWRDSPHSRGYLWFLDYTRHATVGRTPLDE
jgi:hypothetical protein